MWSSADFILDLIKIVVTMNRGKNLGFFSLLIKSGMLRCLQNQAMEQLRSLQRAAVRESSCCFQDLVMTSCHTCSMENSALLSSQVWEAEGSRDAVSVQSSKEAAP